MAHHEKDFQNTNTGDSGTHTGTLNPKYPSSNGISDSSQHTGTLNPNYPQASMGGHEHLDTDHGSDTALRKIRTAGSISISPELFEKLYLNPQNAVKGDLRRTFGNPTPLALIGFLLALTPLTCALMGWRGAGGLGTADIGAYYGFGGTLMLLGSIFEFFLGNTFPFVVFGSFGAFWITYAITLTPAYGAAAAYLPSDPAMAAGSPGFTATFGFFLLWMGFLCLIYLICALRTNIVFVVIFITLILGFALLAATEWNTALGNASYAANLEIAAGGCLFVTSCAGWWIFTAQMLASVDFPIQLPVGDLSGMVPGYTDKAKKHSDGEA